ncbi:hypothetical protein QBC39DRAFT_337073 [Podospora conica]|nr:hypothetical protein QBC39DRAFT_337073 [Schizothecium conicum]
MRLLKNQGNCQQQQKMISHLHDGFSGKRIFQLKPHLPSSRHHLSRQAPLSERPPTAHHRQAPLHWAVLVPSPFRSIVNNEAQSPRSENAPIDIDRRSETNNNKPWEQQQRLPETRRACGRQGQGCPHSSRASASQSRTRTGESKQPLGNRSPAARRSILDPCGAQWMIWSEDKVSTFNVPFHLPNRNTKNENSTYPCPARDWKYSIFKHLISHVGVPQGLEGGLSSPGFPTSLCFPPGRRCDAASRVTGWVCRGVHLVMLIPSAG